MVRVLIVDDSPTIRQLIRAILSLDPELEVVAEAGNGEEALEMVQRFDPNVITMDIHMPKMDGYMAIRRIMHEYPRPIIVLTSTDSDIRLDSTYKGIESGALMVMGKPHGLPQVDREARDLINMVKAMAEVKVVRRRWQTGGVKPVTQGPVDKPKPSAFQIVAIGTSTGGPPALRTIFSQLPAHFPLPVVVVQHISKGFTQGLARWLDATVPLRVKLAEDGEQLSPGVVYIAPDEQHLIFRDKRYLALNSGSPLDGHRPSVTALFNSVADQFKASALGILLTGMGRDGADGLSSIRQHGGYTLAQDKESSVVFGMPKEAIALGAAQEVVSLARIGRRIVELAL